MAYIEVEVNPSDFDDDELITEIEWRGYVVGKSETDDSEIINKIRNYILTGKIEVTGIFAETLLEYVRDRANKII